MACQAGLLLFYLHRPEKFSSYVTHIRTHIIYVLHACNAVTKCLCRRYHSQTTLPYYVVDLSTVVLVRIQYHLTAEVQNTKQ